MGIQVTYKKSELAKLAKCSLMMQTEQIYAGPYLSPEDWEERPDWCMDMEKTHEEYLVSVFYDGVFIGYLVEPKETEPYLWFDNKNVNYEGRAVLDQYGIEYRRS